MVILLVAVDVMHDFARAQKAPDRYLHHDDVLTNVSVGIGARMLWLQDQPITILHNERLATKCRVAIQRTEARTIVAPSANHYRNAAMCAEAVSGFHLTRHRAVMRCSRAQFAERPVEHLPTAGTRHGTSGSSLRAFFHRGDFITAGGRWRQRDPGQVVA